MKMQFIKNCFLKDGILVNKNYRKYNVIDDCFYLKDYNKVVHYTEFSIEFIHLEYLKEYKH